MNLGFVFVPFPREIWDKEIELSQAEFRLLGWFLCNLKFGIAQLEITDTQLLEGFRAERCAYPKVGLSRNSVKIARALLVEKGMLIAEQIQEATGRNHPAVWRYHLNLSDLDSVPPNGVRDGQQHCQTLTTTVSDLDSVPQAQIKEEREVQSSTEKTLPKGKPSDPRHSIFRKIFDEYYQFKNNAPAPWDAKEAGRLSKWLIANPTITEDQWRIILRNRTRSPVSHAKPLSYWIGTAIGWLNGPADDWGKAVTGGKNGAVPVGKADGNLAVLEESLNRGKRKSGANEDGLLPPSGNRPNDA